MFFFFTRVVVLLAHFPAPLSSLSTMALRFTVALASRPAAAPR
jgi:hypothetical protein